jgi:beta-fructofuranosidase
VLEIYVNNGGWVFSTRYFEESDTLKVSSSFTAEKIVWYEMSPITLNYLVER